MFKVIVAGSRDFNDYEMLESKLMYYLSVYKPIEIEIVSGSAKGADTLGERFAKEKGCHIKRFPAEWDVYGKSAGYRRNAEMAKYADACVVFMKKEGSKGSQHMIDLARKYELPLKVILY